MQYHSFNCGCKFEILKANPNPELLPNLKLDILNVPLDCSATWHLISQGLTKGVFQLESNLGRQWAKKLKPHEIEHMAALGSLLRPGALKALDENGVSMTEHYCRRKNNEEELQIKYEAIKHILERTYNVICYQEQCMEIAQRIAGFNLQEADQLRKAIGKKLAEEMAKVKKMFLDGVEKCGLVTKDAGEEIFGWIEKSQRYLFNKSHAVCYGLNGYFSAYCKAHFPVQFYTKWLRFSQNKQDTFKQINELISEAKLFNIEVVTPSIKLIKKHFTTDGKTVYFGLADIKGVGDKQVPKIKAIIEEKEQTLNRSIDTLSWFEFLVYCSDSLVKTSMVGLISVGAFRHTKISRNKLLHEYDTWNKLTKLERSVVKECQGKYKTLQESLQGLLTDGGTANKNRYAIVESLLKLLKNPPTSLEDTPNWIALIEQKYLGIPITFTKIDSCDTRMVNATCKDYLLGKTGPLILGVEIQEAKEIKIKNGQNTGRLMGRLTISDNSCSTDDVVVFSNEWEEYKNLLQPGSTVLIQGIRNQKTNSLVVKNVWSI